MAINNVTISGNLVADAKFTRTQNGNSVLNFTVAVNDRRKDAQGNWIDFPNFIDCVTFGKRAEALASILTKGLRVAVCGKLSQQRWEKDGQKRSKIEVVANDIEFMTSRQQPQQPQPQQPQPQQPQQAQQPDYGYSAPIPF